VPVKIEGEKGIIVLAPTIARKANYVDHEGDAQPDRFRAAYFFGLAQTDRLAGHENDSPRRPNMACPVLTGDDDAELLEILVRFANADGVRFDCAACHAETPTLTA
jgi:hypothetical protein